MEQTQKLARSALTSLSPICPKYTGSFEKTAIITTTPRALMIATTPIQRPRHLSVMYSPWQVDIITVQAVAPIA